MKLPPVRWADGQLQATWAGHEKQLRVHDVAVRLSAARHQRSHNAARALIGMRDLASWPEARAVHQKRPASRTDVFPQRPQAKQDRGLPCSRHIHLALCLQAGKLVP